MTYFLENMTFCDGEDYAESEHVLYDLANDDAVSETFRVAVEPMIRPSALYLRLEEVSLAESTEILCGI